MVIRMVKKIIIDITKFHEIISFFKDKSTGIEFSSKLKTIILFENNKIVKEIVVETE